MEACVRERLKIVVKTSTCIEYFPQVLRSSGFPGIKFDSR